MALLCCPAIALAGVIVEAGVELRSLDATSLRNIYILRQTRWPDGQPIVVFVLPDNHPVHERFAKDTLGIYPYRLRQIWDRLSYSGMAGAPIEVRNETEMRTRVRSTPGAIGYTSKDMAHEGIKTLKLD
ncbi:MAG: hypothetical protein B7Y26_06340 [Hydrogenophilales bacterium 16-64-46]|nr:MAG: hypothetical protein B7Z32_00280 [Hydrogenophilales bacterium 12-64-13]OYZ05995.1 MAG: hypothetical protein B7Y26_06340 [Hydrogenophilales bacterium 16-64-46]OZA39931.1 MAG: hypothetical protein B7X87_02365 [Hydrogenophilales bacterium 17-64-34]